MEYTEVRFSIECEPALKDIAADLLTDMASDCGFEAFTNESDVLTGYAQTEEFDKFGLDNMIAEFPLENVTITYTIDKAPNENWNTTWEDNGFEPIDINGKCVIYDARHVDDETVANDERMTILIEAKQAFGTGTHETTRMVVSQLLSLDLKRRACLTADVARAYSALRHQSSVRQTLWATTLTSGASITHATTPNSMAWRKT